MKNPMSDAYAFAAIRILTEKLPEVVAHGASPARMDVAVAACMAGAAFGNSMVGAVHAIGHALGGVCRIAHGEAMAILLPHVMDFNRAAKPELYDCLKLCFSGEDPVAAVRDFVRRVGEGGGLPLRLRDTGRFDRAQIPEITEKALNDGAIIVNPVHLSKEDVAKLLLAAE
jgi:alcohol dehydrogenase